MSIFGWFRKESSADEPPAEKFSLCSRSIKLVVVLAGKLGVAEYSLRIFLSKLPEALQNEVARLFEESHSLRRNFEERKAYEVENLSALLQLVSNIDAPMTGGHNCLRLGALQICVFHLYSDEAARIRSLHFLKIREVR